MFQTDPDPPNVGLGVIWDGYPESVAKGGWSVDDFGVGLVEGLGGVRILTRNVRETLDFQRERLGDVPGLPSSG